MPKPPIPDLIAPEGYCPQATDTSVVADLLDFYLLRQCSPQQRLVMAADLMRAARQLSWRCLQQQFSHLDSAQFARKLAQAWLQDDCPPDYQPGGSEVTWIQDSSQLAGRLHLLLVALEIPYYITDGVTASAYGEPRTTRDLDVIISIPQSEISQLVQALEQAGFYIPGVAEVIAGQANTLQITEIETICRADLMLSPTGDYAELGFGRRRLYPLPDGTEVYFASPEDLILAKLHWGQQSQSEKQWRDVLAICKVQQEALDYRYLYQWAAQFGLTETLDQLTIAAGVRDFAARQLEQG